MRDAFCRILAHPLTFLAIVLAVLAYHSGVSRP